MSLQQQNSIGSLTDKQGHHRTTRRLKCAHRHRSAKCAQGCRCVLTDDVRLPMEQFMRIGRRCVRFGCLIVFLYLGKIDKDIVECHLSDRVVLDHILQVLASRLENAEYLMQWNAGGHTKVYHFVVLFFHSSVGQPLSNVFNDRRAIRIDRRSNQHRVAITKSSAHRRHASARERGLS